MENNISNMDAFEIMDKIQSSKDLLECGKWLSIFSEQSLMDANRTKIVQCFRRLLTDQLFGVMPKSYIQIPGCSNDSSFCHYRTNEKAVMLYLLLKVDRDLPPVKLLKSLKTISSKMLEEFVEPSGIMVEESFVNEILAFLNEKYSFIEKVFGEFTPIFLAINNSNRHWNSHCVVTQNIYGEEMYRIVLYNLKVDATVSPEYVLLHELGHTVQARFGSRNSPPESFFDLDAEGMMRNMTPLEQCDIFADVFAMAIMYNSKYSEYDPFVDIPAEVKRGFYNYITDLLEYRI